MKIIKNKSRKKTNLLISLIFIIITIIFLGPKDAYIELGRYIFGEDFVQTQTIENTKFKIQRVVDGDTLLLDNNERIRLIGVDTKESVHPNESKNTKEGELAKEFVENLVKTKGNSITLEYDKDKTDRYGRTLAYVYFSDNTMLNELLIINKYATLMFIAPNTKYEERFSMLYDKYN